MGTKIEPTDIGTLIFRKATAGGGFRTCVQGGVSVKNIVLRHRAGETVEQMIAENPLLTPERIHAALAYFHLNPDEINSAIAADEAAWLEGTRPENRS
jgi:uncharacterized protein (DUF433 family)